VLLRVLSATSLLFGLTAALSAQQPPAQQDWKALLEAGTEAEDYADYKKAEALLEQACTLAQAEADAEPETTACRALAYAYAVDEQFGAAEATLAALVTRLKQRDAARPLVETILQLTDLLHSVQRYEEGLALLKQAASHFPRLTTIERVRAMAAIGEMYLAVGMDKVGMKLIYHSQSELLMSRSLEDPATVEVFADLAFVLTTNKKPKKAIALLEPIVAAIEKRAPQADEIETEAHAAYRKVIHQLASSYAESGKNKFEEETREKATAWPRRKPPPPDGAVRVDDGMTAPRLVHKEEPTYTEGARHAGAQGTAILEIEVWPDGRAHNVRVLHYLPYGLTLRGIAAVREWRFQPGLRNREPVKVQATVEINFRLL